jgi:hypothetical protein
MPPSPFTLIRRLTVRRALLAATGAALLAFAGAAGAVTVYKWVDSHGVIHYSDQPHPNAKKLDIIGAQTYTPAPLPSAPSAPAASSAPSQPYSSCRISSPKDQQMLMNAYQATAVVETSPGLRAGDHVQLFLDGKQLPAGSTGAGLQFTFPVYRGQHSLEAVVEDSSGQIVCESSSVTFFVHQPSIQNPHNPILHPPHPPH